MRSLSDYACYPVLMQTEHNDGYFGDLAPVDVILDGQTLLIRCEWGIYKMGTVANEAEAVWRMENAPEFKQLTCNRHHVRYTK